MFPARGIIPKLRLNGQDDIIKYLKNILKKRRIFKSFLVL